MPASSVSSTRCVAAAESSASTTSSCCAGSRDAADWTAGLRPSCFSSRRRGDGPARLAPQARLSGCAGQRSRHSLSADSPARGSRRCRGPHGGRCPGRRGVGAPAVDCTRHQGDESRRGGGDCHKPRAAGCRVVAGAGAGGGRARIRRPLRLATRLTRGRQLARTLHRYVAPSLETAEPLGLNEREFARDLDLPDRQIQITIQYSWKSASGTQGFA